MPAILRPFVLGLACLASLAAGEPRAARLDAEALMVDVRALADPAMEGRGMGTPGLAKARAYVVGRFKALGLQPVGASFELPFEIGGRAGVNLAAKIPGTSRKEQAIVLSAHLDHLGIRKGQIYIGADDDASGVAAVLALAAYFKAHPPAHTVVIALFDGEEPGLLGSRAFVAHPPLPLSQIRMDLSLDMVGRNAKRELYVCGVNRWPKLRPAVEPAIARSGLKLRMGHDGADGLEDWTTSSDHGSFHAQGVPFLYLGEEDHEDYHRPTDTVDRLQPDFLRAAAETALDLALGLDQHPAWMDR